ncbi:uncharacterized protein [Phyllobates terribilis]|uniref:uncharacterized protein isoform X2 n=1 Tax=Phyllobates terribilis TaxID=111132 RepID=UPI003CCAA1A6
MSQTRDPQPVCHNSGEETSETKGHSLTGYSLWTETTCFCREEMARLLFVLVTVSLALAGLVTAEDPIVVHGQWGSDLLLPMVKACAYHGSYRFDLYHETNMIGVYDDELQGRNGYSARLMYDTANCMITLKRLNPRDGTRFTVELHFDIDQKPREHDITYLVTISDPPTSHPSTPVRNHTQEETTSRNGTQVSDDGILSFVSFCLSLDSAGDAIFGLLCLILRGICYILILIPIMLLFDILRSRGYLDCLLNDSLISFFRNIFFCCTCCSDDLSSKCKRITRCLWSVFTLLIQVLFTIAVGILSFGSGDSSGMKSSWIGYLVLSLVLSLILKCGVSIITHCCYKRTFAEVPTDDPTKTTDDHEKVTSV